MGAPSLLVLITSPLQVDYLFASELCGEEQRLQEEATEMMRRREEEVATRGSPTISRQVEKGT